MLCRIRLKRQQHRKKTTQTTSYNSLYNRAKLKQERQKERCELVQRFECPFSPKINIKSKIMRENVKESKDDFVKRMAYPPKKEKEESKSLKSIKISDEFVQRHNNKDDYTTNDKLNTHQNNFVNNEESEIKTVPKINIKNEDKYYIKNAKLADRHHTPALIKSIERQQNKEKGIKKYYAKKVNENIDKFKLNNLKEIFEIIYKYCSNIEELHKLDNYGVSEHTKENLIIPTCQEMKKRNLEFNFQNFYLVANEIMNFIFS